MAKKANVNPFCPVPGCRTKEPHEDDSFVKGFLKLKTDKPAQLAQMDFTGLADIRKSIKQDIQHKRTFAWITLMRQIHELYTRAVYLLLFARDEEAPHLLSEQTPNTLHPLSVIVQKALVDKPEDFTKKIPGKLSGEFSLNEVINQSAHVSFKSLMMALGTDKNTAGKLHEKIFGIAEAHLKSLGQIKKMFDEGKDRAAIIASLKSKHSSSS